MSSRRRVNHMCSRQCAAHGLRHEQGGSLLPALQAALASPPRAAAPPAVPPSCRPLRAQLNCQRKAVIGLLHRHWQLFGVKPPAGCWLGGVWVSGLPRAAGWRLLGPAGKPRRGCCSALHACHCDASAVARVRAPLRRVHQDGAVCLSTFTATPMQKHQCNPAGSAAPSIASHPPRPTFSLLRLPRPPPPQHPARKVVPRYDEDE